MNEDQLKKERRQAIKDRFMREGLSVFSDEQVIELLLFYGNSRQDTEHVAHRLFLKFGSLSNVLNASLENLQECGLSYNMSVLLKLIPSLVSRFYISKTQEEMKKLPLQSQADISRFILPYFIGKSEEQILLLLLNSKSKSVFCDIISKGSLAVSNVNIRDILQYCVKHKASRAILAHNHPSGIALPSAQDIKMTKTLHQSLLAIGVILQDHFIIADMNYCSMADMDISEEIFG